MHLMQKLLFTNVTYYSTFNYYLPRKGLDFAELARCKRSSDEVGSIFRGKCCGVSFGTVDSRQNSLERNEECFPEHFLEKLQIFE